MKATLRFGKRSQDSPGQPFAPLAVSSVLNSPSVSVLARRAEKAGLNDHIAEVDPSVWAPLFAYSVMTEFWRGFPRTTPVALAQNSGDSSELVEKIMATIEMLEIAYLQQEKCLNAENLVKIKASLEAVSASAKDGFLEWAQVPARFSGLGGKLQVCARPAQGRKWVKQISRLKLSQDRNKRLVQSWLISLWLLAIHPFCNGNGRLSRLFLNAVSSFGRSCIVPFSIFFLLRNGKSLHPFLMSKICRGQRIEIETYFSAALFDMIDFCQRVNRDSTAIQKISLSASEGPSAKVIDILQAQCAACFTDRNHDHVRRLQLVEPLVYGG